MVVVLSFGVVTVMTSAIVENSLVQRRVSDCLQAVNDFSVSISYDLSVNDARDLYASAVKKGLELSGRVLVLDRYGIVQVDSFSNLNGAQLPLREVLEVLGGTKEASYGFHKVYSDDTFVWTGYYTSVVVENSDIIGAVLFSQDIQDVIDDTNAIRQEYILIDAVATGIVAMLSYLFTNHISKPLEALRVGALALSQGNFSKRVEISGNDEVANLGNAFNTMAARLEDVDRQRSEFVSNASHELKTPLSSMKILAESVLYQDGLPEAVYKDFLADINKEIDRLTCLINDLLLMTKLQNLKGEQQMQPADVDRIVREVIRMLQVLANRKNIRVHFAPGLNGRLLCFPVQLRQAVSNLLDNAIKYTPAGGNVYIRTFKDGGEAKIEVMDTGEGIENSELSNIFERFYRVDKARARETGGTGLGLYIVRTIAIMHGGRIDVKSKKGEGSVFTFVIPARFYKGGDAH